MGGADVCDDGCRRAHQFADDVHLARATDAHFNHADFFVFDVEQRERHTDLRVVICLGLKYPILCRERGRNHLARRGLAHASGHADQRKRKTASVPSRERL